MGRLPILTTLDPLDIAALKRILTEPKNALVKQYSTLFSLDGVELEFDDDALTAIAEKAHKNEMGARGLRSIVESIMTRVMFEIPSNLDIAKVVITRECVEQGSEPKLILDKNNHGISPAAGRQPLKSNPDATAPPETAHPNP